jgi:hypothetical protein
MRRRELLQWAKNIGVLEFDPRLKINDEADFILKIRNKYIRQKNQ